MTDLRAKYLALRRSGASHADALDRTIQVALEDPENSYSEFDLQRICETGRWQDDYLADPGLADPEPVDPTDTLADDLKRLRDAALEAQATGNIQMWVHVERLYQDARKQYARERLEREHLDQDRKQASDWQSEAQVLERRLLEAYSARGPQYEVLCSTLAPLVVKLKNSYAGGIRLTTEEQSRLASTVTSLVSQLQKHTEATQTETRTLVQAAVVGVLKVMEPHLIGQPNLWAKILADVETRASQLALGPAE